jgi:hypothetical protein
MGYASSFFAVDLDELRRAVAEHDMAVVRRVQAARPDRFGHTLHDGDPPLGEALRRIVAGEARGRGTRTSTATR